MSAKTRDVQVGVCQPHPLNLTTSENTTYYYLGDKMVAMRKGTDLSYIYQDHLGGTAVTDNGTVNTIKYSPWGTTRSGSVPTDKKSTGQRLDGSGLYYYNDRYYDATIGRFISADTIVPNPINPQSLNRYTYVFNNPLRYTDPGGHMPANNFAPIGGGSNPPPPPPPPPPSGNAPSLPVTPPPPTPAGNPSLSTAPPSSAQPPGMPSTGSLGETEPTPGMSPTPTLRDDIDVPRAVLGVVLTGAGLLGTVTFGAMTIAGVVSLIPTVGFSGIDVIFAGYMTIFSLTMLGQGLYMMSDDKFGFSVPYVSGWPFS